MDTDLEHGRSRLDPVFPDHCSIPEDDGLGTIGDDAAAEMPGDRPRENPSFNFASLAHEIVGRVVMADTLNILFDDRTFVEIRRNIMRGGADQLHAAGMRLMVGFRALEPRQERMVDVDAPPRQLRHETIR
jgi:hypothetical protein